MLCFYSICPNSSSLNLEHLALTWETSGGVSATRYRWLRCSVGIKQRWRFTDSTESEPSQPSTEHAGWGFGVSINSASKAVISGNDTVTVFMTCVALASAFIRFLREGNTDLLSYRFAVREMLAGAAFDRPSVPDIQFKQQAAAPDRSLPFPAVDQSERVFYGPAAGTAETVRQGSLD